MAYSDLLKDPRWQRKRLEVMALADFACAKCGDTKTTLNVHHIAYKKGRKPWEYTASELQCLCQPCHKALHDEEKKPKPPTERSYTLTDGPAAGRTTTSAAMFPLLWVFEKDGGKFFADDEWRIVRVGKRVRASHFPQKGHPYANAFMYPNERAGFFRALWSDKPYPVLLGAYGWVSPGTLEDPTAQALAWADAELILLRLEDVLATLQAQQFDEADWFEEWDG